jgi:transposase
VGATLSIAAPFVPKEASRWVLALKAWFEQQLACVSTKSVIAEAIRYALHHWDGLSRFLDDGRIELDTNIVERSIRPIVLNRKNALFAGHDDGAENWACIASLIETCKLNGVDPQTYFTDVLTKLVNLWPQSRLDELMPWAWAANRASHQLAA